ncbi:MAG: trans-sulfuration enzyme family protein [Planctomycetota bacterium]
MCPFGTPDHLDCLPEPDEGTPVVPDLTRSTVFEFGSRRQFLRGEEGEPAGHFYPRYGHVNGLHLEALTASLERAGGSVSFASGMAASSAVFLALLEQGDRLALSTRCYGGVLALASHELPRFGIGVLRFDPFDPGQVDEVLSASPKLVHVETPVNPTVRVIDLPPLAERVHGAGALLCVDATFLPPPFQRVLELGADLSIHSATKFLGGHTDVLAGVASGGVELMEKLEGHRRRTGAVLAADLAWLLIRSLKTLELRVRAQCETARQLAGWLEAEAPNVGKVHYPGLASHPDHDVASRNQALFGSMLSFEVHGGHEAAWRVFDGFDLFRKAPSLGGVESLVCLPADSSHRMLTEEEQRAAGFGPGTIRLSVGLEPLEELREDLLAALRGRIP